MNCFFRGEECDCWFKRLNSLGGLLENDFFFAFDIMCKKSVVDYVKAQNIKGIKIETFRKPYLGGLLHYIRCIKPLKRFLSNHPSYDSRKKL